MRLRIYPFILLVILAVVAACRGAGDESSTGIETATETAGSASEAVQAQPAGSSSFFSIDEVGLGPDGYVTLTNFTDVPVTLAGLSLCQDDDCFALPDVAVAPGSIARVAAGSGGGLEDVVASGATFGLLRPSDGELALYAFRTTDEPGELVAYLQWGSTPHALTAVAIEAGLWLEGSYAPSGPNATRLFRNPDSGLWLWE